MVLYGVHTGEQTAASINYERGKLLVVIASLSCYMFLTLLSLLYARLFLCAVYVHADAA